MTDREKAIVMAYTGICMLKGDKLSVFYEYVESIMGRPVYTHEMGTKVVNNLIKEKARPDFISLCADESRLDNPNKWIGEDVIDKIRAEIADIYCGQYCENPMTADAVREMALEIIDKYTAESEE